METSTAGKSRSEGSRTSRPVSGLIFDGKSSASGPDVTDERRGWGVAVDEGMTVIVEVLLGMIVSITVGAMGCGRGAEHVANSRTSNTEVARCIF